MCIEQLIYEDNIYAIIIYNNYYKKGINFFTPEYFSQQVGLINYPRGKVIEPHKHSATKIGTYSPIEILYIRKGQIKVSFYSEKNSLLGYRMIKKGDLILLVNVGHGLEIIKDAEMYIIKQGPYEYNKEKIRIK